STRQRCFILVSNVRSLINQVLNHQKAKTTNLVQPHH
ncbi:carbamoyl-phosphate synthase L chain, ATP binding domain protein, partial [Vibrio parahaemolyticus V-223/04]